jgi:hypothetical protein
MCLSLCRWYTVCALPQWSKERIVKASWQPTEQNNEDCSWQVIARGKVTEPSS